MTFINYIFLFYLLVVSGCKSDKEKWVDDFCAAFQDNTNSNNIDWDLFRITVSEAYDTSKHIAIERGLTMNNNRHSFYSIQNQILQGDYGVIDDRSSCKYTPDVLKQKIGNSYGYINVPTFVNDPSYSEDELIAKSTGFVRGIYNNIKNEDRRDLLGWIIDLRFNRGGDMWVMLLAIRPFLENGILGHFINDQSEVAWSYNKPYVYNGYMKINNYYLSEPTQYELSNKRLPIAVLLGSETASSGEAVAIALQSIPNMRYFGDSTAGLATANSVIEITNDEFLVITGSTMANADKTQFPRGIKAKSVICEEAKLSEAVSEWINQYGK